MPYSICLFVFVALRPKSTAMVIAGQICLIVKHKAQNNAKDSKGLKHSHEHM